MSIASDLVAINDAKQDIKDAIEAQGVSVGSAPLADYAGLIEDIETADEVDCLECADGLAQYAWTKPAGFPDLPAIFAASTMPNKKFIILMKAGKDAESGLSLGGDTASGSISYVTSDGASYASNSFTHTWNPAFDIDSGLGYMLRWVIVGRATASAYTIGFTGSASLHVVWFYAGAGLYSSSSAFGNVTSASANKHILAIHFEGTSQMSGATLSLDCQNCANLESVRLPPTSSTCTTYTPNFNACVQLQEINDPPSTVTAFGTANMFSSCMNLRYFKIPAGVTSLGGASLFSASGVCELDLPLSLSASPNFNGIFQTSKLRRAHVNAKYVGNASMGNPFNNCTDLKEITFAADTYSGSLSDAWAAGTGIEEITIPSGVTGLGTNCFSGCRNLRSITIPSTVTLIDNSALTSCTRLRELTLPSGLTTLHQSAITSTNLKSLTVPSGVTALINSTSIEVIKYLGNMTSGTTTGMNDVKVVFASFGLLDVAITFSAATMIPKPCLVGIIASLKDNSGGGPARTLTMGAGNTGKLSAGEIAVATAKNWTLA